MASFSVVSLMKEEASIIRRFVDYYQKLGAERIFILYDGGLDDLAADGVTPAVLAAQGAELLSCDDAFWLREAGKVPEHLEHRQRAAFAVGHARNPSDWLLVCDADEFVIDRMPVAGFLDRIPIGVDSVVIPPAEAVWGPGESIDVPFGSSWFRRPGLQGRFDKYIVYGPMGVLFRRGLLGHALGKQFVRRGARFDLIHQHFAYRDGKRISVPAAQIHPDLAVVELAHFDAISYARWYEKFRRPLLNYDRAAMRERSWRRRVQIHLFKWAMRLGKTAPRWLCRASYGLNARQLRQLERRGHIFQAHIFETPAL